MIILKILPTVMMTLAVVGWPLLEWAIRLDIKRGVLKADKHGRLCRAKK